MSVAYGAWMGRGSRGWIPAVVYVGRVSRDRLPFDYWTSDIHSQDGFGF